MCGEPGELAHSERSGAGLPYEAGDVVTYTCLPQYHGGGNITCLENGSWTDKPACSGETAPTVTLLYITLD